jgi:hypothetical protein
MTCILCGNEVVGQPGRSAQILGTGVSGMRASNSVEVCRRCFRYATEFPAFLTNLKLALATHFGIDPTAMSEAVDTATGDYYYELES